MSRPLAEERIKSRPPVPIQICSDLHLEAWQETSWRRTDVWKSLIIPSAPYLALVGDISVPGMLSNRDASGPDNFAEFLRWVSERFIRVFVVLGNHELFTLSKRYDGEPGLSASAIIEQVSDICEQLPGVELLHRRSVVIEGDIRVIGATLWSYIDLAQDSLVSLVENSLSDYQRILVDCRSPGTQRLLTVSDTVEWHSQDREFIKYEIQQAQRLGQRCLVLTHYSPAVDGTCKPEDTASILNCAFATDLVEDLVTMKAVHSWVYGHTHSNARLQIQDTALVSNQLGYRRPNSILDCESYGVPYDPEFVIHI